MPPLKKTSPVGQLQRRFEHARLQLGQTGYVTHGSVQDRTDRTGGGAGYQWTRKVAGRTITVALNAEQFAQLQQAVANYRRLQRQIRELEQLSRSIIFHQSPHLTRRKPLPKKVLGTN